MWLLYGFITIAKVGGDAAANIAFNFWLRSFPNGSAAQFTVLMVSAIFYLLLFVPPMIAALLVARKRAVRETLANCDEGEQTQQVEEEGSGSVVSSAMLSASAVMQKLRSRKSLALLFAVGASDFWIDAASTYAAGQTSVLTQAFAKGLEPFITWLICLKLLPASNYAPVSSAADSPSHNEEDEEEEDALAVHLNPDDNEDEAEAGTKRPAQAKAKRCSPLLIFSFVFSAGGLLLHLFRDKFNTPLSNAASVHTKASTEVKWFYVGLYIVSIVGNAFYNISMGSFMRHHKAPAAATSAAAAAVMNKAARNDREEEEDELKTEKGSQKSSSSGNSGSDGKEANNSKLMSRRQHDVLIRLVVLGGDMIVSFLLLLLLGSFIDSIPGFGSSASPTAAWEDFRRGLHCIVSCNSTFTFTVVTFAGWGIAYIADTYLNAISPPLSSMVAEMSAPIQALVLIAVPAWAIDGGEKHDWQSTVSDVGGLLLMALGVCLYLRWETRH